MKKDKLKKVKLKNASNIELICRCDFSENDSKSVMLYCSGFGGTYGEMGNLFSDYARDNGMSFMWGQFQDTYDIKETKQYNSDGSYDTIKIGATYSHLGCTKEDFDCFLNYAKSMGYENVHIVATCVSCSKIIKYLLDGGDKDGIIKSLALLAPQDLSLLKGRSKHIGLTEEARIYMSAGMPDKLLSKNFVGYMPISAASFMDICYNDEYNTLPYLSDESRLANLRKVDMPVLFVLGGKDGAVLKAGTLSPQECVDLLSSYCNDGMGRVIDGAPHLFDGQETEVVKYLNDFYISQNEKNMNN